MNPVLYNFHHLFDSEQLPRFKMRSFTIRLELWTLPMLLWKGATFLQSMHTMF